METINSVSSVGSVPLACGAERTCGVGKMIARGAKLLLTMTAFWFLFLIIVLGIYNPSLHALATSSSVFFVMTGDGTGVLEKLV